MLDRYWAQNAFNHLMWNVPDFHLIDALDFIDSAVVFDNNVATGSDFVTDVSKDFEGEMCHDVIDFVRNELGFRGCDSASYHQPKNSLIRHIVNNRRANPISLAIVAIDIGHEVGCEFVGIGMPGHFLLRETLDPTAFYDLYHGVDRLGIDECENLFHRLHPSAAFESRFLAPTPYPDIVIRVLNNLRNAYVNAGDRVHLMRVLELREALPDMPLEEQDQLAKLLAVSGRFDDAGDRYEAMGRDAEASRIRAFLN